MKYVIDLLFQRTKDKTTVTILRTATSEDFVFRTVLSGPDRLTLLAFSLAIWRARNGFYRKVHQPSFVDQAGYSIAQIFLSLSVSIKKKMATTRDRSADRVLFLATLVSLPTNVVRVFTDGSAYAQPHKPGPAGGAFWFSLPDDPSFVRVYHSECLGNATTAKRNFGHSFWP